MDLFLVLIYTYLGIVSGPFRGERPWPPVFKLMFFMSAVIVSLVAAKHV